MQRSLQCVAATALTTAALSIFAADASAGSNAGFDGSYGHAKACTSFGHTKICLDLGGFKHHGSKTYGSKQHGKSKYGHKSSGHGKYGFGGGKYGPKKGHGFGFPGNHRGSSPGVVYVRGAPRFASLDVGWDLLFQGELYEAEHFFSAASHAHPYSALPQMGLSLAQARLGNESTAIRLMRRAVLLDVTALHQVPDDYRADKRLKKMKKRFRKEAGKSLPAADALFMVAALETMRGDVKDAYRAIKQARDAGCRAASTEVLLQHLKRLKHYD